MRDQLYSFNSKNIFSIAEEFTEKLDKFKTQGMTEEQYTTAKDIRRRGKNKVGRGFYFNFNVYLFILCLILMICSLFVLDLFVFQNAAQNCRKRANDRLTDLTEGTEHICLISSL